MIINNIKTAFRQLLKNRYFWMTNILGLSIGIAACLLISGYVHFELGYDENIENLDNLYRVLYERESESGEKVQFASASPTIGPAMMENFPEVEEFARAYKVKGVISFEDFFFKEENMLWVENAFLDLLSYELIRKENNQPLKEPNSAVISEDIARKYFGNQNPLGKSFKLDGKETFRVTGVFRSRPENMHYKADILLSYANWENRLGDNLKTFGWVYSGFYTYVRLEEGVSKETIDSKIQLMLQRELSDFMERTKLTIHYSLQPVKDIHLTSHYMHELRANGNKNSVTFLQIISWFILLIAWINFVNLITINSMKRRSEINLRKVLGGTSRKLISQFILESLILNSIALVIALILITLIRPWFSDITGIPMDYSFWSHPWFWLNTLFIFSVGTLLAGSYPVWGILSRKMAANLKNASTGSKKSVHLRKSLVTFQFLMATVLIAGTISVYLQLQYLKNQEQGFNKENILVIPTPRVGGENLHSRRQAFKETMKTYPFVRDISFSSVIPGKHNMFNRGGIYRVGDEPTTGKNYRVTEVDHNYMNVYSNIFIAGRNFSKEFSSDQNAVIINVRASRLLGFNSPVDAVKERIMIRGQEQTIIGVIQNFHQESPRNDFEPQIFRLARRFNGYFSVKLLNAEYDQIQQTIQKSYGKFFPGNPFDYFYMENFYQHQYQREEQFGSVFGGFSLLAIVITIVGILSLSSFTAAQRRKEIGIRKAIGADRKQVVILLSKSYLVLLAISFILAIPVIYYGLHLWLDHFASRMSITPWIFIIPVLIVLLLSMTTVVLQAFSESRANPVEALRYE